MIKCSSLIHELLSLQTNKSDAWYTIWNERQALKFAHQVADGMVRLCFSFVHFNSQVYLSHRGFVHRDLAARNVLVKNDVAKVRVKKSDRKGKQLTDLGLWPVSSSKRAG